MATSESDDFESADEELTRTDVPTKRGNQMYSSPTAIDSESDDDTEYVPRTPCKNLNYNEANDRFFSDRSDRARGKRAVGQGRLSGRDNGNSNADSNKDKSVKETDTNRTPENIDRKVTDSKQAESLDIQAEIKETQSMRLEGKKDNKKKGLDENKSQVIQKDNVKESIDSTVPQDEPAPSEVSQEPIVKKSESKVVQPDIKSNIDTEVIGDISEEEIAKALETVWDDESSVKEPDELKSNKKFKEVFEPQGWEGLGNEIELPEELTEEKLQPIFERLSTAGQETESSTGGWGDWGSWGVSSLINTATAGVSTITSHVSHGLELLEESIGAPDPAELWKASKKIEQQEPADETDEPKQNVPEESPSYTSFGFGNFLSGGVSSITKLVESTSSKVMSGGLDTLEAIGKKTMEVLQEGDPGLKKKRAFFMNDSDKPNLSQILRDAKEKADATERTIEEKQMARRVHFESLFDDYQGLVHLEALEMLSKQSTIKIQQYLVGLDTNELKSIQETLEEVKELCDLDDDNESEDQDHKEEDLKLRLQEACNDLGVNITYEKLFAAWEETRSYLTVPLTHTDQEIFQSAVSALAKFTAFSVERFHKSAELILIKSRRSTVNEADALVQLTRILSNHVGMLADMYCSSLNELEKVSEKPDDIKANITTIFMEAANASSYIQDAFRLLIPIIQVGAI